jgi:hypothetical protein
MYLSGARGVAQGVYGLGEQSGSSAWEVQVGKVANVYLDEISRHGQVQTQRFGLSAEIPMRLRKNSTRDAQDPTLNTPNFLDHDRSA